MNLIKTKSYWILDEHESYIDITSGGFAFPFGYANEELIDSVSQEMRTVSKCMSNIGQTTDSVEKAEQFLKDNNWSGIIWTVTGTGAVEAALQYTTLLNPNKKILSYTPGWHGTSIMTKQLSATSSNFSGPVRTIKTNPWRTDLERSIEEKRLIERTEIEIKSHNVGILVINPAPWYYGLNIWSNQFWLSLKEICEDKVTIIVDDVASCWGKTGEYFSHTKLIPFKPDVVCIGKAITGGYAPLGATLFSKNIWERAEGRIFYGHTFRPYMGGIGAFNKSIEIINREKYFDSVENIETNLRNIGYRLKSLDLINTFRVYGQCASFDVIRDNHKIQNFKKRYYGASNSSGFNSLRVCPMFIADNEYFDILETTLIDIMS